MQTCDLHKGLDDNQQGGAYPKGEIDQEVSGDVRVAAGHVVGF